MPHGVPETVAVLLQVLEVFQAQVCVSFWDVLRDLSLLLMEHQCW